MNGFKKAAAEENEMRKHNGVTRMMRKRVEISLSVVFVTLNAASAKQTVSGTE